MESKSTALLNITTRIQALTLAALIVLAGGHSLLAQPNLPGDGSDGPLNVTSNTVIDLGQAVIGGWADNNAAGAGKGVYDPSKPAFVFKYSSVSIAQGATVSFANWPPQVPVVWWVADAARPGPEAGSAAAAASLNSGPQPATPCRPKQSASMVNFGEIRADGGGSLYLIAPTIDNRGAISVREGRLGLLAGEQAAISRAGDAGKISVCVSQPNGAVANTGELMADGGAILIQARNLDQEGVIQADSAPHREGKLELIAADSLVLGPASRIFARGNDAIPDSTGGEVTIKSGNAFADVSGSRIEVGGGALGGNGGHAEICAPRMPAIRSIIVGQAAAGFANGELTIDPLNILLVSSGGDGTSGQYSSGSISYNDSPATGTLTLDVNAFSSTLSQIHLEAVNNIELSTVWTLPDSAAPAALTLTAGNSIILDDGSEIDAGNNWSVNLTAGTEISPGTIPAPGAAGVYLNGSSYLQTMNGDITVLASNEVIVSSGAVRTEGGGNITIAALAGDVNSGTSPYGFDFGSAGYTVDANLGGISTAAGGNVNITAGSDVVSFLPPASGTGNNSEAGAGAFGAEQGNVSLTAGHDVLGHFVLRDGSGKIQAGNNAGETAIPLALSLVSGGWTVNATQNVNLQEVRNPNGMFNAAVGKPIKHYFDYAPQASVSLAAHGIYLLGGALPRLSGAAIPALYPPILNISAGGGGANLGNNVTLFPSPDQSLVITTTDGGNLTGSAGSLTSPIQLFLSDSAQAQWASSATFTTSDHGSTPTTLNDPNPLTLDISGTMEDLNLIVSAAASITVAGDVTNCGFSGQNLYASEVTSIRVGGRILNQSAYIFANDVFIPEIPSGDVPGVISSNHWDTIFRLALNPSIVANLTVPANLSSNAWLNYALQQASLFGVVVGPEGQLSGSDEGFVYNSALGQLAYGGPMSASLFAEVSGPLTILHLVDGIPVVNANGYFETDSYTWAPVSAIQALFAASQAAPSPSSPQLGYRLGGPGQFNVSANSISLGNTAGILSCGVADPQGGFNRYNNLALETSSGAALQVSISGNLDMLTSTIAAIGGGNANVTSSGGALAIGSPDVFNIRNYSGHLGGESASQNS